MTTYDSGLASRLSRASGTGNARSEIDTLRAPGVVAAGPDFSNAAQLGQLLEFLRSTGQVAGQIGDARNRTAAELRQQEADRRQAEADQRREEAEQRRIASEDEMHDRGMANLHSDQTIVTEIDEISKDKLFTQDGDAATLVSEHLAKQGAGYPEAYQNELVQQKFKPLVAAINARRDERAATNLKETNFFLQRGAIGADSGTQLLQYKAAHKRQNPNATDLETTGFIIVPALNAAAQTGNKTKLDNAMGMLGPEFDIEKKAANATFEQFQQNLQARNDAGFIKSISGHLDTVVAGKGGSFDHILSLVDKGREAGVHPNVVLQQREAVLQRKAEIQRDADKLQKMVQARGAVSEHLSSAMTAGTSGMLWSVGKLDDPISGAKLSEDETRQAVLGVKFEENFQTSPTPEHAMIKNVQFMGQNAVMSNQVKSLIGAGASMASLTLDSTGKLSEPMKPSPTTLAAYEYYNKFTEIAPGMVGELPESAVAYFSIAQTLQTMPEFAGKPELALMEASRIQSLPAPAFEKTDREIQVQVDSISSRFWGDDAGNPGEIRAQITNLSHLLMRTGIGAQKAVERAAETVGSQRTFIGNWSVSLADAKLPDAVRKDIQKISAHIFENFVAKHGKESGLDVNDLTLQRNATNNTWFVVDGNKGHLVGKYPREDIVFDAKELEQIAKRPTTPSVAEIVKKFTKTTTQDDQETKAMILKTRFGF